MEVLLCLCTSHRWFLLTDLSCTDIPMVGAVQEEEEEPEHEDAEHDTVMSGGPEDQQGGLSVPEVIPADFMSVDGMSRFAAP